MRDGTLASLCSEARFVWHLPLFLLALVGPRPFLTTIYGTGSNLSDFVMPTDPSETTARPLPKLV